MIVFKVSALFDSSSQAFFIPFFNDLTAFSAIPFDVGWKGGDEMCLTPLLDKNLEKFSETKGGPLSVQTIFGNPKREKHSLNNSMVPSAAYY